MQDLEQWAFTADDNLTLRGWRTVSRGLPVIFFMHGNGLCGMAYWPMLKHLRNSFDIVLLDAPGHGASDSSGGFAGWEQDAIACFAAWQSIADEYVGAEHHLVAHSYGGVLATIMLAEHPEAFQSAVLLDPVFFPPRMLALGKILDSLGLLKYHKLSRKTRNRQDLWPCIEDARQHLLDRSVYKKWESACIEGYLQFGFRATSDGEEVGLCCDKAIEARIYATLPYRLPLFVNRVRTPCVVISGDQSYDFVVKSVPNYCANNPVIEHREILGGHNFMLEQTENAARWVRECIG